jgi:hypothetical protein
MNANKSVKATFNLSTGVSRFDGSYTGSYSGTAIFDDGTSSPVNGSVTFTVANGFITVTNPGSGSGRIQTNGSAAFSSGGGGGSGVSYSFSGTFSVSPAGAAAADGGWSATFSGGAALGEWGASR